MGRGRGVSVNSRPAWSTYQILGQDYISGDFASKTNKKKTKLKRKKEGRKEYRKKKERKEEILPFFLIAQGF